MLKVVGAWGITVHLAHTKLFRPRPHYIQITPIFVLLRQLRKIQCKIFLALAMKKQVSRVYFVDFYSWISSDESLPGLIQHMHIYLKCRHSVPYVTITARLGTRLHLHVRAASNSLQLTHIYTCRCLNLQWWSWLSQIDSQVSNVASINSPHASITMILLPPS